MARSYQIIEAPSVLGLAPTGVEELPDRLLADGLATALGVDATVRVAPLRYEGDIDADTQTLNAHAIAAWSPQLADAVEGVLDAGAFPVVLGGDCSILLGTTLALRRRGRYGLLFLDGHADFYQPDANPNGQAASMELAFATGRGPAMLADLEGRGPLVRDTDVVALGMRDGEEQAEYGSQPLPAAMTVLDLAEVRRLGAAGAAHRAVERLASAELDGFFVHLDADVLDDAVMPAVDYRLEGGLRPEELVTILRIAMDTGRAVGLEVTIYNPRLDPDGSAGRCLGGVLRRALADGPMGTLPAPG